VADVCCELSFQLRDQPSPEESTLGKSVAVNASFPADIVSPIRVPPKAKKAYDFCAITRGSRSRGGLSLRPA